MGKKEIYGSKFNIMANTLVKYEEEWREIDTPFMKVHGNWVPAQRILKKVNGEWVEVWSKCTHMKTENSDVLTDDQGNTLVFAPAKNLTRHNGDFLTTSKNNFRIRLDG